MFAIDRNFPGRDVGASAKLGCESPPIILSVMIVDCAYLLMA